MSHRQELQFNSSNSSSSCSTPSSLSSTWSFSQQSEFEQLPIPEMISVLDEMCHLPELAQHLRRVLSNPYTVSKIFRSEPDAQIKLTLYFQWLEKATKNFVWTLTESICRAVASLPDVPYGHLLGFRYILKLGTFFTEAGWYAEAIILLTIAKGQAKGQLPKILQVLKVLVLAQTLSNRHEAAFDSVLEIQNLAGESRGIPVGLAAELHCASAVYYFENRMFEGSYHQGVLALELLAEGSCSYETIIGTFRLLGRSCIPLKKYCQAKLLITQAVSWARHTFGSKSVVYAEALEDYAFYLLMMDAYTDAVKVASEAKNVFYHLYGHLGVQPDLAQGNLAFQLYLECYGYRELGSLENMEYLDFTQRRETSGSDDRQTLAVRRMRTLAFVGDICDVRNAMIPIDGAEGVKEQMEIDEVRRMFFGRR